MAVDSPSTSPHFEHARALTTKPCSQTSSSRCTQCNARPDENAKNLVVCIDGTYKNTNVAKLFAKIDLKTTHPEQTSYYSNGIDITRPESRRDFRRNIEGIVKDAYGWLARTYQEGDQIYLFGFAQSACQVRMLAGMIHEVDLTRKPREKQIGTAYDHYQAIRSGNPKTRQIAREFKNRFSWKDLKVHFVGVWETVYSTEPTRGDVLLSTSPAAVHACHFRHALALDERRVGFMPEYFHEVNSQMDDGKSKYIVTSPDVEHGTTPAGQRHPVSDSGVGPSEGKKKITGVKEVWFAGSHSDVGGRDKPGMSHQAGNVSLLWMRREAAANGLVLEPTDIVWVPDDLDFGISNSMTRTWRVIEYLSKPRVSFSGAGEDVSRQYRSQSRRIIPGQKVHASVLYANTYKPQGTLGEGFDIPIINSGLEDMELDTQFWETGLFDKTAAQQLVTSLSSQQEVASIYLDRLLFMLRFKEGKRSVRNVPHWQNQFLILIHDRNRASLDRLVTTAAYYDASCDHEVDPNSCAPLHIELSPSVFNDANNCLRDILAAHEHRDGPRVLTLLRPLTKHQILRERILTQEVLETLVKVLDAAVRQSGGKFGQAMDGLNCLLQCEYTRYTLVEQLGANPSNTNVSRLSLMLKVDDPPLLTAALRVVLTLMRIPEARARAVCSVAMPRIRELASRDERLVGPLAVEILLVLCDPNDQVQLDIRDARVRANLGNALSCLNPERHDSADGHCRSVDSGEHKLRHLFGLDATELSESQRKLIGELTHVVREGNPRERTDATMTLLKLCETETIRTYLLEINLLHIFVSQLAFKHCALLAAYALATCLRYSDMKESIRHYLPRHIVRMLTLDYFDDAVGHVEGFQIFGDFMQHADLRENIMNYNITEILNSKLGDGRSKEVRTGLIILGIFRSFDHDGPWTRELVAKSLEYLQNPVWKHQKAGVMILSALAQTEHGMVAICPRIHEIVEMLLPEGYQSTQPTLRQATPTSPSERQTQPAATTFGATRPPLQMLGPACALRVLAQNKILRDHTRETMQYASLKHLYLSETLVDEVDTSPWLRISNRNDVVDMLDKMFRVVDEELSEEGLVLPQTQHGNLLILLVGSVVFPPAVLGASAAVVLSLPVFVPIYLSGQAYRLVKQLLKQRLSRNRDARILDNLRQSNILEDDIALGEIHLGVHEDESAGGGESSQGVETMIRRVQRT